MLRGSYQTALATLAATSLFTFDGLASKTYPIKDQISNLREGNCIEETVNETPVEYCSRTYLFPKINGVRYLKVALSYTGSENSEKVTVIGANFSLWKMRLDLDIIVDGSENMPPDGVPDYSGHIIKRGKELKALKKGGADGLLRKLALTTPENLGPPTRGHIALYDGILEKMQRP